MANKTGTNGNNSIYGTSAADLIRGLGGNDYLNGQGGNDTIEGGLGADKLDGAAGNDTLRGGDGKDFVGGGTGNDMLYGDAGDDYLYDLSGIDQMFGGAGNDRLVGTRFTAKVDGGTGNDTMAVETKGPVVSNENLIISGGTGTDTLHIMGDTATWDDVSGEIKATLYIDGIGKSFGYGDGFWSNSAVQGTFTGIEKFTVGSNTRLAYWGGDANATVTGSSLNDIFASGSGNETFIGGKGSDEYNFSYGGHGSDKIVSFDPKQDVIVVGWWDSQGENVYNHTKKEHGGWTTYTVTELDGDFAYSFSVDAVGIPESVFKDMFSWG